MLHFHSGSAPIDDYFGGPLGTPGLPDLPGAVGIYISEVVWYNVRPITFMIWGGVFERFPKLRVAVTEGLREGDLVVVDGMDRLRPGGAVEVTGARPEIKIPEGKAKGQRRKGGEKAGAEK